MEFQLRIVSNIFKRLILIISKLIRAVQETSHGHMFSTKYASFYAYCQGPMRKGSSSSNQVTDEDILNVRHGNHALFSMAFGCLQMMSPIVLYSMGSVLFGNFILVLLQLLQNMSSLIDEDLFDGPSFQQKGSQPVSEEVKQAINKMGKINEETILVLREQGVVETLNKFKFHLWEYGVRCQAFRVGALVRTVVYLLDGCQYWHCRSRQNEILLMKELVWRQRERMTESTVFLERGRVGLMMSHSLVPPRSSSVRWVSAYHQLVIRNVMSFEQFLHKQLRIVKRGCPLEAAYLERNRKLMISQILNTTQTTEDINQDRNQFRFANKSLEKQNQYLNLVEQNIVPSREIQKTVNTLFINLSSMIQSQSLRTTIINSYQDCSSNFKTILKLKYPAKRRIQDYLYNKVKVELLDDPLNGRNVGSGGSCVVNQYRMNLTFIGSLDSSDPPPQQLADKVEKTVAVKKIKPGSVPKNDKIAHQKKIVSQLRSSVTQFIPKYYEIDKPELKNCLLMERINGEQLDFYLRLRSETISFWSRINLIINIIHGLRHLISYGIVHLDLKPINILVCRAYITKIIDFGESYHPDICPKNYTPGRTYPYTAPQVHAHYLRQLIQPESCMAFSQKQDVFALGIIMSEVIFGDGLFHMSRQKCIDIYSKETPLQRVFYAVERNELFGDDLLVSIIGFLIIRCLDADPQRRPCVEWIGIILKLMLNSYGSNH